MGEKSDAPLAESWHMAELTRDAVAGRVPTATVVLPCAAVEQHGPQLPIMTDTCIVSAIASRVARTATIPVLVAPTLCYGASQHHFPFPGVMSLTSPIFAGTLRDLLDSLARMGARRVYLLNGHGGNDELVRLITREEAPRTGMAIGAASYWSVAWDGLLSLDAHTQLGPVPGHAGHFETALMLALRPDLVRRDQIPVARSEALIGSRWPDGFYGTVTLPTDPTTTSGTSDDASQATATWGERLLAVIVRDVTAAIEAFHRRAEG